VAVEATLTTRIERLRQRLEEPFLVTNPVNVRYLTGMSSSNAALLVEPERVRVFTDFRYAPKARKLADVDFVETSRDLPASLSALISGRIAFEAGHVTYAAYETLARSSAELVPRHGVVERLRWQKDPDELAAVREAVGIGDRAFAALAEERFVGRTEADLVWRMEQLLHEHGGEGLAFPVIVGAGPTGSTPHADPGERVIQPNESVVVDAGTVVVGYNSDCTRTFATGELRDRAARAYEIVRGAQQRGVDEVRAGRSGREVDSIVREIVDATEFAGTFGHGLGHGVGLQVHEGPSMRRETDDELVANAVVSVEPGIYVEGEFGIRIEDLVVVTDEGCEVLTQYTKDLVMVR
jgi:Xaa-Pro aminopeptidase